MLGEGHKHRVVDLAETWRHDAGEPEGVRCEDVVLAAEDACAQCWFGNELCRSGGPPPNRE